jgi:hypothetical protein
MLNIERALKKERLFRALTGFNRQAFTKLLSCFSLLYQQSCYRPERQRALHHCETICVFFLIVKVANLGSIAK